MLFYEVTLVFAAYALEIDSANRMVSVNELFKYNRIVLEVEYVRRYR